MVECEVPPIELPKEAEIVVLGRAGPAIPGHIISLSETEIAVESTVDAPVNSPVRIRWDTHVALGEVLEVHNRGTSLVTRVSLHHFMDVTAAAEASTYWS